MGQLGEEAKSKAWTTSNEKRAAARRERKIEVGEASGAIREGEIQTVDFDGGRQFVRGIV